MPSRLKILRSIELLERARAVGALNEGHMARLKALLVSESRERGAAALGVREPSGPSSPSPTTPDRGTDRERFAKEFNAELIALLKRHQLPDRSTRSMGPAQHLGNVEFLQSFAVLVWYYRNRVSSNLVLKPEDYYSPALGLSSTPLTILKRFLQAGSVTAELLFRK